VSAQALNEDKEVIKFGADYYPPGVAEEELWTS